MKNSDYMLRAVVKTPAFRLALGSFRTLCTEGIIRHDTDPVAGRLLADALASTALLSVLLDEKEKYSVRIDYTGPAGAVVTDAGADGRVRGFIRNPHVMAEADSLEAACGDSARVRITKSTEGRVLNMGDSSGALVTPSEGIAFHFSVSDQIESEIRCDIELAPDPEHPVKSARAVLIQAMPGCDLEELDLVRRRLLAPETEALPAGDIPEEAMRKLMCRLLNTAAPDYAAFAATQPEFACSCSARALTDTALQLLGREEAAKLLAENPSPALRCQFCNTEYHLSAADFDRVFP